MNHSLVTVAVFAAPWEADLCQQFLAEEGVWSSLRDRESIAVNGLLSLAIGGVRLQVRPDDASRAWEFLLERELSARVSPQTLRAELDGAELGGYELHHETAPPEHRGLPRPPTLCTSCGHHDVEPMDRGPLAWLFLRGQRLQCRECGHDWDPEGRDED